MGGAQSAGAVVVTGAAGFIGRAVLRELVRRGERAVGVVRTAESAQALAASEPRVEVRAAAVDDVPSCRSALEGIDVRAIVHLAGGRVPGGAEPNERANVGPTAAVSAAAAELGVSAFVLASTAEVYGRAPVPFVETAPPSPVSAYARSKLAAERAAGAALAAGVTVARMGVVYGPGQIGTMLLPQIVAAARAGRALEMTAGLQTRDFVFVNDAAEALVALAGCPSAAGEVVNVGTGEGARVLDVAQKLAALLGAPDLLRIGALPTSPEEIMHYVVDASKLAELTGFRARTPLDEGLRLTAAR
jgi:nucleoside-diphosphate-sugar epimerase